MLLRLCFVIATTASVWFTVCYFANNEHNDKIFIAIFLFEVIVFSAVDYHLWITDWLFVSLIPHAIFAVVFYLILLYEDNSKRNRNSMSWKINN